MSDARPAIPAAIKREVRRRCHFGCVMCGAPVIDYDHMVEYAVAGSHDADNITLLCTQHHAEKTRKRLPLEKVLAADAAPYNAGRHVTGGHLLESFVGSNYAFNVGTNLFMADLGEGRSQGIALNVDGGNVFSASIVDGELLIRAFLRDACNRPLLRIHDNELVHTTAGWDVVWEANRLKMWTGDRVVGFEISFEREGLDIIRGEWWANGLKFAVVDGAFIGMKNTTFIDCQVYNGGFYAGDPQLMRIKPALNFGDAPRYIC
ncbi:MAG: HNH endonuclease [Salinibacterium sp.]|nr:HNH endonuclease signature motif containing protein [Salinibacterium sp.]MBF0671336.1 HNH endonuclease [Salinibacterium sp.]